MKVLEYPLAYSYFVGALFPSKIHSRSKNLFSLFVLILAVTVFILESLFVIINSGDIIAIGDVIFNLFQTYAGVCKFIVFIRKKHEINRIIDTFNSTIFLPESDVEWKINDRWEYILK